MHPYWQTSIEHLARTRPQTIKRLQSLGIHTYFDLINYFPFRYEDYSLIAPIASLQEGETVTIQGTVTETEQVYTRRHLTIQKITLTDRTGSIEIAWFNQPFILSTLSKNTVASVAGVVKKQGAFLNFEPHEYEILPLAGQKTIHTARLIPVYSEIYGLSTKTIRDKVFTILHAIPEDAPLSEMLPQKIVEEYTLISTWEAYKNIHSPESKETLKKAQERLSFDELFTIQLGTQKIKEEWQKETVGHIFTVGVIHESPLQDFIKNLPFTLTNAQQRVWHEIKEDLSKKTPMNRFVQGDVGSGKTVIAALAAYTSFLNGYQTLYMAPTEILAEQHHATFQKLFESYPVKVGLQTGAKKMKGEFDIIIGTQALVTEKFTLDKVGLVIVDEQHRFGVAQRAQLKQKGANPHLLSMTATPIPRTVMLTLYGELDMSVVDELPKGRKPIKTFVVPPQKRNDGYEWIKKQIRETNSQVFIICPLIEESEGETMQTVKAAEKEYEHLKSTIFTTLSVGLLHGRMKPKEKEAVMKEFKDKKYDILVSTSVVEVGIDVPNASIMLIEGAERFGLAQLHQLRGRVGRGELQSYCLLFTSENTNLNVGAIHESPLQHRLQFFSHTNNGMELAEYDLKRRGPGDIYGKRQHGYTDLKIANLSDLSLIERTKAAAQQFHAQFSLDGYPTLKKQLEKRALDQVSRD